MLLSVTNDMRYMLYYFLVKKIHYCKPHVGLVLLQLVWSGVAILSIHLSIPDWPSWNQSSAFEGQSGVNTCPKNLQKAADS